MHNYLEWYNAKMLPHKPEVALFGSFSILDDAIVMGTLVLETTLRF